MARGISSALAQWKDDKMEQCVLSAAASFRTLRRCGDRKALFDACMLNLDSTVVGEDDMMPAYPEGK